MNFCLKSFSSELPDSDPRDGGLSQDRETPRDNDSSALSGQMFDVSHCRIDCELLDRGYGRDRAVSGSRPTSSDERGVSRTGRVRPRSVSGVRTPELGRLSMLLRCLDRLSNRNDDVVRKCQTRDTRRRIQERQ